MDRSEPAHVPPERPTAPVKSKPSVLFVPGLRWEFTGHWQNVVARSSCGSRVVMPLDSDKLSCRSRVMGLEAALRAIEGPVVIVAHHMGVMVTAHWAQWAEHRAAQIHAALLLAPPDLENPHPRHDPPMNALRSNGWLPIPRRVLPFRAVVGASTNDPFVRFKRAVGFARDWKAQLMDLGPVASGGGDWIRGEALLGELLSGGSRR